MHLTHSVDKNNFTLMLKGNHQFFSTEYNASSLDDCVELDYPFKSSEDDAAANIDILCSCNGLILCKKKNRSEYESISLGVLCLWNPCTTEYKIIPSAPVESLGYSSLGIETTCGICYDGSIDDYKVVRIVGFRIGGNVCEVKVYTLGTSSWRTLEPAPYQLNHKQKPGVLVNEKLHWIVCTLAGFVKSEFIVSFDISSEKFTEMLELGHFGDNYFEKKLAVLGENLCFIGDTHRTWDLWEMKDYGVKESWTKLYCIGNQKEFQFLRPIHTLRSSEVLLEVRFLKKDGHGLVLFKPKLGRANVLKMHVKWDVVQTYVGSLVSLESGTYAWIDRIDEAASERKLKKRKQEFLCKCNKQK
ncbi:F-box protein CPR1-like [Papaver somniferum]|uniref:F-box protein CPR1-like n=1 Tax=Papaver somniferum TaxID=3469 RepID=UPI000E6FB453|nr:F-box protein CPR1-like [Papaver somniferum]